MAQSSPRQGAFTFARLLARYGVRPTSTDVTVVSLSQCLASGHDPLSIRAYLGGLGHPVSCLGDLLAFGAAGDDDDLGVFAVREGVAVTVSSQGTWVLFKP